MLCSVVSFYGTAQWISHLQTHLPSFLDFLPIEVTTEHWVEFPGLYSRSYLVIYFIHSIHSVYISTSISQFIPSPHPALISICLFSISLSLFLLCKKVHQSHFSGSHIFVLIHSICFSFWLHSVWESLGLCKDATCIFANGMILFLFMVE